MPLAPSGICQEVFGDTGRDAFPGPGPLPGAGGRFGSCRSPREQPSSPSAGSLPRTGELQAAGRSRQLGREPPGSRAPVARPRGGLWLPPAAARSITRLRGRAAASPAGERALAGSALSVGNKTEIVSYIFFFLFISHALQEIRHQGFLRMCSQAIGAAARSLSS